MNIQDLINDKNTTIVDVRTEGEFVSGNVDGSINIPLDKIVDRAEELKKVRIKNNTEHAIANIYNKTKWNKKVLSNNTGDFDIKFDDSFAYFS